MFINDSGVIIGTDFGGHYQNVREYWEHYEKSGKK